MVTALLPRHHGRPLRGQCADERDQSRKRCWWFWASSAWRCCWSPCSAPGQVAIWSLVLCGVANSIMYPTIFALGIAELGPLTSEGSGVITIGNVGGAVIPLLFGAAGRQGWNATRIRHSHRRLPLHHLLWPVGVQAEQGIAGHPSLQAPRPSGFNRRAVSLLDTNAQSRFKPMTMLAICLAT